MANSNLTNAKKAKKDEFYTQWNDIQKEISAYIEYDKDVFRGKTILLPCDDPEWSNFTKFFALNFENFGLKKLISTSFAVNSKAHKFYQLTLFEKQAPQFDRKKTKQKGKIFTLTEDITGDGKVDIDDLQWEYMAGDGDFRSDEVKKLRDEADIIITNPPFSLFREFLAWIVEANTKFLIIGNKNCITFKEVFPLIKNNKIWAGVTSFSKDILFIPPEPIDPRLGKSLGSKVKFFNGVVYLRSPSIWLTNIDHGKRHQPLALMSKADNLKFNKNIIKSATAYQKYDNYDAIEVPYTNGIPSDFDGVMGVPISFLDKYSPEQFDILGIDRYIKDNPFFGKRFSIDKNEIYARILIKHKKK